MKKKLDPTVYEKAADLIQKEGHWKGSEINTKGQCIFTALDLVCTTDDTFIRVDRHVKHLIKYLGLSKSEDLFKLNDKMNKKWAVDVLHEIAEKIRANE